MNKITLTLILTTGFFLAKSQTGSYSSLTVGTTNAISLGNGAIYPASNADSYTLEMHATKFNVGQVNSYTYSTANTALLNAATVSDGVEMVRFRTNTNTGYFNIVQSTTSKFIASFVQAGSSQLYLSANTNNSIGIATNTPNVNAKLDVNGAIYSGKIFIGTPDANTVTNIGTNLLAVNGTAVFVKAKVAIYGSTWPDYVFAPSYKLTPLDSLEQFIQLNKHLPEMPTASDVEKNGIDLGENQALLLKKIEELTLMVIEQNKRIAKLEINQKNN